MRALRLLVAISALLPLGLEAQAGQVVGTGGTSAQGNPAPWNPSVQGGATIEVTTNNPRLGFGGFGDGSLEMTVTGNGSYPAGYPDWGFWYRFASGSAANRMDASFGSLSDMSSLSFDWFRTSLPGWDAPSPGVDNAIPPADWAYKTPVMRLRLLETPLAGGPSIESELVWEGYYNSTPGQYTPVDQWVSQTSMQNGNFWYSRPPTDIDGGNSYMTLGNGCAYGSMTLWAGTAQSTGLQSLLGQGGCLAGSNVQVIGIAVGVGSQWPLPYHGYVDNVRMGFAGQDGLALDANFDFVPTITTNAVVPEPSTYALVGIGLALMGFASRRKR